MDLVDRILKLSKQLLPTGRAFRAAPGSNMERLLRALARSEARAYNDATSVLWGIIPDNRHFTVDNATDWERRLGLINGSANPLNVRIQPILRKMQAPGRNPAKSHYLWIEHQLQAAGFPVNVYENIPLVNPATLNPAILSPSQHGGGSQHGMQSHYLNNIVFNRLDNSKDIILQYHIRRTFIIGGSPIGTYANIPATREREFRQLVLGLKQCQQVAILFINYI
jgi:hypothetical protein